MDNILKRCTVCNKKVYIAMSKPCACGMILCINHRYKDQHNCTLDMEKCKQEFFDKLLKNKIKHMKIQKI
jgi:hypothetical protein